MVSRFVSKTVPFKFRGISLTFDLTQGLFSSAGVDSGTQLLLKVFSRLLDEDAAAGKPAPRRILDCGCGCGIIGICAAAALAPHDDGLHVHCQDRDELARLFTLHNAAKNNIPPAALTAYTEPLLAGDGMRSDRAQGDLILTNIPAKTGTPVLEDFVRRSAGLLNPGGRVIMVAVAPLADFFRERIIAEAELLQEEKSPGHTVFVYTIKQRDVQETKKTAETPCFITNHPFYIRTNAVYDIEHIPVSLTTVYGAEGFDHPGGTTLAAAKLAANLLTAGRMALPFPRLIHEPEQGFFPCWLNLFQKRAGADGATNAPVVLSGRNILALEATAYNVRHHSAQQNELAVKIVPAVDLQLADPALRSAIDGQQYGSIIAFPELLPQSSLPKGIDQLAVLWNALPSLLADGGIFLAAFGSSEAERFDRKKAAGFTRLGSVKRKGFRALAYRWTRPEASPPESFSTSSTDT
jgi:16S rRNA G1207 methylase RsmC